MTTQSDQIKEAAGNWAYFHNPLTDDTGGFDEESLHDRLEEAFMAGAELGRELALKDVLLVQEVVKIGQETVKRMKDKEDRKHREAEWGLD